ncbi:alginate export family protein [Alienimonas chondri]|uniref:alginate export family protein n=1 Tax=Alienimonas chondri TaxID=2681879 RepID=UPI0014899B39|nr:alginate export family protein [Alienimonas chondri]
MLTSPLARRLARGVALTLLCGGPAYAQSPPPAPAPASGTASGTASASTETAVPQNAAAGPTQPPSGPQQIQQGAPGGVRSSPAVTPPPSPYKPLFFENDFSGYVGKPPYIFGEDFKLVTLSECPTVTLTAGGQVRHRMHSEDNRLRPDGETATSYQLLRNRNYVDLKTEYVRAYVESINAYNAGSEIDELIIDENRWDLLNAFVDFHLYDVAGGAGTFRVGRQEILYGDQHLLSPLDWSNTRRNFEGYKFIHQADDWRLDLFSLNPVNGAAGSRGFDVNSFDEDDEDKPLWGAWLNRKLAGGASADLFYIGQDREAPRSRTGARIPSVRSADGLRHLVGGRLSGTVPVTSGLGCDGGCDGGGGKVVRTWDYDVQGGYQFGDDDGEDVSAAFFNAAGGHTWNSLAWKPRVGALFYYGSGDDDPNDGENNTFYTYYPLAHAYWGIIDNLNGQNLLDYALFASVKPTDKLSVTGGYHLFRKDSGSDFLYNVAQVGLGPRNAGTDIGNELDVVANYQATPNLGFQLGYAHFWYGDFAEDNFAQASDDGEFVYFQTTFNY